jgi:hypothetical protein
MPNETMLAARARLVLSGDHGVRFSEPFASLAKSFLNASVPVEMEFLVGAKQQRSTIRLDKVNVTSILLSAFRPVELWDHAHRGYFECTKENLPQIVATAPKISRLERDDKDDEHTLRFAVNDSDYGTFHLRLRLSPSKELARFGPALLRLLYCGADCDPGRALPLPDLADAGCIERATLLANDGRQLSEIEFFELKLVPFDPAAFTRPAGFAPLVERLIPGKDFPARTLTPVLDLAPAQPVEMQALDFVVPLSNLPVENQTESCLGETRYGSLATTFNQELFNHLSTLVNAAAPFAGTATIADGMMNLPWMRSISSIRAAAVRAATPPTGVGLAFFLHEPRSRTQGSPNPGGKGLLDRLAFSILTARAPTGRTRLEEEARAGTLETTLTTWGLDAATIADALAAGGNPSLMTFASRVAIVAAYQDMEFGVIDVAGLPSALPVDGPGGVSRFYGIPGLYEVRIHNIGGTISFPGLGSGAPAVISTPRIGSAGDVSFGLALPNIDLTGRLNRRTTAGVNVGVAIVTGVACFLVPYVCIAVAAGAGAALAVLNNLQTVRITIRGTSASVTATFEWNATLGCVAPRVDLSGTRGTIDVVPTWDSANLVGNLVDSLVAGLIDLFRTWEAIFWDAVKKGLESGLRGIGMTLPHFQDSRPDNIRALRGRAVSEPGKQLVLTAALAPISGQAVEPSLTQVPTEQEIGVLLATLLDRVDTQGNPPPPAPSAPRILKSASYLGTAHSQNALNTYLFDMWRKEAFSITFDGPATLSQLTSVNPTIQFSTGERKPALEQANVSMIHVWPACPPRAEIMMSQLQQRDPLDPAPPPAPVPAGPWSRGGPPLLLHFDDLRVCMERIRPGVLPSVVAPSAIRGMQELQLRGTIPASVALTPRLHPELEIDIRRTGRSEAIDFIDTRDADLLRSTPIGSFNQLAQALFRIYLSRLGVQNRAAPQDFVLWTEPLPIRREMVAGPVAGLGAPQQLYNDVYLHRRSIGSLPLLQTTLLELFDGSGAPTLNGLLSSTGAGLTTLTPAQGRALAGFIPLPTGP